MRTLNVLLCSIFLLVPLYAEETVVSSTIKSVGLFKNGIVVVQEEIDVPGGGRFLLAQVPVPIRCEPRIYICIDDAAVFFTDVGQ